jgi:hypothetical protein
MARSFAAFAALVAALLLAGSNAIIVGRVYRPIAAPVLGAMHASLPCLAPR